MKVMVTHADKTEDLTDTNKMGGPLRGCLEAALGSASNIANVTVKFDSGYELKYNRPLACPTCRQPIEGEDRS